MYGMKYGGSVPLACPVAQVISSTWSCFFRVALFSYIYSRIVKAKQLQYLKSFGNAPSQFSSIMMYVSILQDFSTFFLKKQYIWWVSSFQLLSCWSDLVRHVISLFTSYLVTGVPLVGERREKRREKTLRCAAWRGAHSGQTQKSNATSGFSRLELRKSLKRKPARLL